MANHMPHPWTLEVPTRGPVQIKSRHGFQVGTALTVDDGRVMAAAPELLAALESIAEDCDRYGRMAEDAWSSAAIALQSSAEQARAVIAKAKGGAS